MRVSNHSLHVTACTRALARLLSSVWSGSGSALIKSNSSLLAAQRFTPAPNEGFESLLLHAQTDSPKETLL